MFVINHLYFGVSLAELLAELYTCHRKRCKRGYCFPGEGECHRPCVSRARGGNREVLLYVHVPLFSATCAVVVGRLHHGCVARAERCSYAAAPK